MPEKRDADLTPVQKAFIESLDDETVAELIHAAKVIGNLDADSLAFIQSRRKEVFDFLRDGHEDLFKWLRDRRKDEVSYMEGFFKKSMQWQGVLRMLRIGVAVLFSFFAGCAVIFQWITPWLKAR